MPRHISPAIKATISILSFFKPSIFAAKYEKIIKRIATTINAFSPKPIRPKRENTKIISKKNAKTFKKPTTTFVNFLIFSLSISLEDLTTATIVPIITIREKKIYIVASV